MGQYLQSDNTEVENKTIYDSGNNLIISVRITDSPSSPHVFNVMQDISFLGITGPQTSSAGQTVDTGIATSLIGAEWLGQEITLVYSLEFQNPNNSSTIETRIIRATISNEDIEVTDPSDGPEGIDGPGPIRRGEGIVGDLSGEANSIRSSILEKKKLPEQRPSILKRDPLGHVHGHSGSHSHRLQNNVIKEHEIQAHNRMHIITVSASPYQGLYRGVAGGIQNEINVTKHFSLTTQQKKFMIHLLNLQETIDTELSLGSNSSTSEIISFHLTDDSEPDDVGVVSEELPAYDNLGISNDDLQNYYNVTRIHLPMQN